MSINYRENKGFSKRKVEPFTASDLPKITPEMIQYYIAEGQRLRAEMVRKLSRKAFSSVARACRRVGQTVTGWTRNRNLQPLRNQEVRPR